MITSADEFARLRTSNVPEEYLRAATEEAPYNVWVDIIGRYPELREWVAHNKTVPLKILEILAEDNCSRVRASVAMKRKLTNILFSKLAKDRDPSVRQCIACNKKTPIEILKSLSGDRDETIRIFARQAIEEK